MKVREQIGHGDCEGCSKDNVDLNVVTFEGPEKTYLLCKDCLNWTRELLDILDVKEAEA